MSEYTPVIPRLDTWHLGRIQYLGSIDSTNTAALEALEDGLVVVAEAQTAGRGRHGNRWSSARGLGVWCSICIQGPPRGLTFAAAVAVHQALSRRANVRLKWPNDVLCDGKKLAGILVEHRRGWNALGMGINVHHRPEDFPQPLRPLATSLDSATGLAWDRQEVLAAVLAELAPRVRLLRGGGFQTVRQEWEALLNLRGHPVRRGDVEGVVSGFTEEGALRLNTAAGEVVLPPGDVEWLEEE